MSEGVLKRYASRLPLTAATPALTIGEGSTPLVRSRSLEREFGVGALYFKLEGCNPTGSFKDRGMVVAVAKAMEEGMTRLLCASTGNTSASASAFGAASGLETVVLIPEGSVAPGKMSQAVAYGARIVTIQGNFDDALRIARELAAYEERFALVNSVNPNRLEGQKTAAFEIVDDLGDAPDYLFIPVGNAGNITAYWRGFVEYHQAGLATRRPRMMGMEAAGAAPIVEGAPVLKPETVASAIRIGNPANWAGAVAARDESGGTVDAVTDSEILEAYGLLPSMEGIFCEPASAAGVAGLIKQARAGADFSSATVVCIITGTGLKDTPMAEQLMTRPPETAPPDMREVARVIAG
ncbi:MAG: threonine synthase [Chloroflexi bacterium]|nr:threonine synthase [Chloroflexota bacterium]